MSTLLTPEVSDAEVMELEAGYTLALDHDAAFIAQGALASLMALTGTFEELTNLFIFAVWIFYGLAVVALFRMRRTEPQMARPYRCWGYPWVPGIFVAGALALTVNIWINRPVRSSVGLLLILAGLPFYRYWRRRTDESASQTRT